MNKVFAQNNKFDTNASWIKKKERWYKFNLCKKIFFSEIWVHNNI